MKITPTSLTVTQLFSSTNEQYFIPTYQRRYSWHERQIVELIEDIALLEDDDTHLLGSIVCLASHHKAGLNRLELVDGQQRLTTVSILLECIRQRLELEESATEALELRQLLHAKSLNGKQVRKVDLDSIDADEFADLIAGNEQRDYKNADLVRAFKIIRERAAAISIEDLLTFLYRLKNQAIVIRLDVGNAKDAFKLFETINNRGLKLSPTDIIKNFLLGNAARLGASPLETARKSWTQLLLHLDGTNPDAFFRYYLMAAIQTQVMMSEVVGQFKETFMSRVLEAKGLPDRRNYTDENESDDDDETKGSGDGIDVDEGVKVAHKKVTFKKFLEHLVASAEAYGEIVLAKTSDKRIDRHLRNLKMIKAVQTYGFLMHLRVGGCPDKDFREILKLTENFVLRRHVCRERANDTERLFARLCGVDPADPIETTRKSYRELCPDDETFKAAFEVAHFPANLIERARYCLERIEISEHGNHDELQVLGADDVHVEHIMPQKIRSKKVKEEFGDWLSYLGPRAETQHPQFVDRIGNLTLFAGELNIGASNNPFVRKKTAYEQSAIRLTQKLLKIPNFRFKEIEKRSQQLAERAVALWPRP
jgi:hypothetical protein